MWRRHPALVVVTAAMRRPRLYTICIVEASTHSSQALALTGGNGGSNYLGQGYSGGNAASTVTLTEDNFSTVNSSASAQAAAAAMHKILMGETPVMPRLAPVFPAMKTLPLRRPPIKTIAIIPWQALAAQLKRALATVETVDLVPRKPRPFPPQTRQI